MQGMLQISILFEWLTVFNQLYLTAFLKLHLPSCLLSSSLFLKTNSYILCPGTRTTVCKAAARNTT